MLFYTLWDACEFVFVYFVYIETKGPTLEEIAMIFDGPPADRRAKDRLGRLSPRTTPEELSDFERIDGEIRKMESEEAIYLRNLLPDKSTA
jgi:hypothetical protein